MPGRGDGLSPPPPGPAPHLHTDIWLMTQLLCRAQLSGAKSLELRWKAKAACYHFPLLWNLHLVGPAYLDNTVSWGWGAGSKAQALREALFHIKLEGASKHKWPQLSLFVEGMGFQPGWKLLICLNLWVCNSNSDKTIMEPHEFHQILRDEGWIER